MLVLSRREDQSIVLRVPPSAYETEISVTIASIRGDKCRLAFTADRSVVIHRKEIMDAIDTETT